MAKEEIGGTAGDERALKEQLIDIEGGNFADMNISGNVGKFYSELGKKIYEQLKLVGKNEIPIKAAQAVVTFMKDTAEDINLTKSEELALTHEIAKVYESSFVKNAFCHCIKQGVKSTVKLGFVSAVVAVTGLGFGGVATAMNTTMKLMTHKHAGFVLTMSAAMAAADAIEGIIGVPAVVMSTLAAPGTMLSVTTLADVADKVGSVIGVVCLAKFCKNMGYPSFERVIDKAFGHTYVNKAREIEKIVRKEIEKKLQTRGLCKG